MAADGLALPASRSGRAAYGFLIAGVAGAAAYLAGGAGLRSVLFGLMSLATILALIVGVRRNRPRYAAPWWYVLAAVVAFTGGAVLRLLLRTESGTGLAVAIPDALVVPGYVLLVVGIAAMLRRRRASRADPARMDAFLVAVCAVFAAWCFLIVPMLTAEPPKQLVQVVATCFPIFDTIVLAVVVQLLFIAGGRAPVLWLLGGAAVATFLGDLAYALNQAGTLTLAVTDEQFEAIFLLAFIFLGAAALHPSMRELTEPHANHVNRLGLGRTLGILLVAVAPTIAATIVPPTRWWDLAVRLLITIVLGAIIVVRIVRAHNAQARAQQAARKAERAERHRATHDALTDLPNRELLTETLAHWGDRPGAAAGEISLLFIDLDRFKDVNDKWGHPVGDELLESVGCRLRSLARDDDLICRIGGDEFVVAMASPAPGALADELAERVVGAFARPFPLSVGEVIITPSVGISRAAGATDPVELIRDADTAMYQAKEAGRNNVALFDREIRERVRHRIDIDQALRGALDRGELSVHYQPIIELQGAEPLLSGFEALVRWNHPEHGAISPVDFIPIAEDTGLIAPIGEWVLDTAVAQLAAWQRERPASAPELHVSVNVAVRQLRGDRLPTTVRRVLDSHRMPPEALWLEITESGAMADHANSMHTLTALSDLGITLCIDDFGTGHSSLSYLRLIPADIVKIDKSFVMGMTDQPSNEAIVRATIAMAKALGRRVVAEGVETAEQRDLLRALGADLAQGYLFGQPRPGDAEVGWLHWPPPDPPHPKAPEPRPPATDSR
ncbi:hypothetical protein GCM10010123_37940 [Pilimelia anulata]|uniref:Diguanylate cyclase/phosphodiesterase n=1 Tax=Pilimelia anulata TaxID=53371 RepID=A0A8J3FC46_9ACTN|nr:EAL domain-containing protein [Pilimelia anulata]GGK04419.1 hypothetical protein GCM10010123_37940 [Pilimelia anulata]